MTDRKRKRVVLSIDSKLKVLNSVAKGVSYSEICEKYGIGKSTITTLRQNEAKIREFASTMESTCMSGSRKVMRLAKDEQLDQALYLWFVQQRSVGMPISGPILCEKAKQLSEQLHAEEATTPPFSASSGWLWRFCNRHGIRRLSLQGEKLSADTEAPESFKKQLQDTMEREGLTLEQVYNCDETGLYYRMLPTKTLAAKTEKNPAGMKKQKERVTLMACSNATGSHKLPLLFIGKAANPRCFKHVNKAALPVVYKSQKNAWADAAIFTDWFNSHFIPSVTKHLKDRGITPKALLLLDNAPAHPDSSFLVSQDKSITAMYLPPNTTALIQPMDQGVLEAVKRRYRRSMLRKLLLQDEEGQSVIEGIKGINMKDVVYMSASAWDDIPAVTLTRSWNKLLVSDKTAASNKETEDADSEEQSVESLAKELDHNLSDQEINEWLNEDANDPGYQIFTDEEIVQQVVGPSAEEVADLDDDADQDEPDATISSGQAADMLDQCMKWYERQEEATASSLLLLKRVRDLAAGKRYKNLKQLTLSSFFQASHSAS